MKDFKSVMEKIAVREALKFLAQPSLKDALDPTKYRIVRITPSGLDVVPVKPERP